MTKIMHLPTPRRNLVSVPMSLVAKQNVVAIRTPPQALVKARQVEAEPLDRIRIWFDEGGKGGGIQ